MSYQKQQVVEELDGIIKESSQLKKSIKELRESKNAIDLSGGLTLISFYSDVNALDHAKDQYNRFIEEAEKRNNQDALVEALEQLGDSEYKRSGHDGYKAAMAALVRAAEMREGEQIPQKEKLKKKNDFIYFCRKKNFRKKKCINRSFDRLLVRSKFFKNLVRADAIDLVQKSSNFEPSSRFFGRLKILNSKRRRNEAFEFDSSCRAPQRALQLESNSNATVQF